jgi:hypothetical protein
MPPDSHAAGQFEPALRRILWELRDYMPYLVVIGGWVPYLYQRHGGFAAWAGRISLTAEVDVLLTPGTKRLDRRPVAELLRASGFEPVAGTSGAAWQADPQAGERVEFLMSNLGTARQEGFPQPVAEQPNLAAVALDDLQFLYRHTGTLTMPMVAADGWAHPLSVRVPLLGAYVVNKAITFSRRRQHLESGVIVQTPKRAKDLLYLHDVLAGGKDVADRISGDLASIRAGDAAACGIMEEGSRKLRAALDDRSAELAGAIGMLAERDGLSGRMAAAQLRGFLEDLEEILADAAG